MWAILHAYERTTTFPVGGLPARDQDATESSLGLRNRVNALAGASDPLSEEIDQVRDRQEGCRDACKNSRCMMHAKVLLHRYEHNHHNSLYDMANQCDRHQRRCSVLREDLDNVHVDRQEERQDTVPEDGASGQLSAHSIMRLLVRFKVTPR